MGWSTHHAVGLIYYAPQHCYRGYTLITNNRGFHATLIDMEGRVCHRWHSDEGIGYAYLLPNGHLLLRTNPPDDAGGAEKIGGSSGALLELDWESNVVWEHHDPMIHHDYERLPNGNTLVLLFDRLSAELTAQIRGGRPSGDDPDQMFGDKIQEITPDGRVVYEWRSWEHWSVDEDVICPLEDRVKWKWGPGDIDHQHHPTWLDNGRILLFDNGFHRPRATYSRVIEVDPSTNEIAWEYMGNPALSFYSQAISSCERQPNGNTLICEGSPGRIFEVTPNKEIVWEYINPLFITGANRANPNDLSNAVFRAHRYGPDHPALEGKDLDPARYANINSLYARR